MKWRVHHVNLSAPNFHETIEFYEDVFQMQSIAMPIKREDRGAFKYDRENLAWFEDDNIQLHVSRPNPGMARDNNFYLNPSLNGHLAIEVDDIEAVKRRFEARGLYYADPGHWAVQDLYQIYAHDPSMNVIEVNQRIED